MLDALTFEKLGVPTAVLITEPFVPTADAIAELSGMAGYGYVVAEHPFTSLDAAGVASRADAALDRVEELLSKTPRRETVGAAGVAGQGTAVLGAHAPQPQVGP